MIKEVLLSVSGTVHIWLASAGERKSVQKGKLLLGAFQGHAPRVAF